MSVSLFGDGISGGDDIADVLSQVTIVDGFGSAQAAALGQTHAQALSGRAPTVPDPAIVEGLRKLGEASVARADADRVEKACEVMHDAYEAAAPQAGWATQTASRKPWADVPEPNKATMRVAVRALIDWLES